MRHAVDDCASQPLGNGKLQRLLVEIRSTVVLAWPLILTNLAQLAQTATNLILIGRLGSDDLAAAALAIGLYDSLRMFSMGVISATMPMVARAIGQRHTSVREVRRTIRQGFWSAVLISIPAWILLWNVQHVLILLGQSPVLSARSAELMHMLQWSLLPYLCYIVLSAFLAALKRPVWSFLVIAIATIFNAVAAWSLIFGKLGLPAFGVAGAGIASSLASLLMFTSLATIIRLRRRFRRYHLLGNLWLPDWPRLAAFWQLGLPMGITAAIGNTFFYASAIMMGWIGLSNLAAHAIVLQIESFFFMVPIGLSQAATVRVGLASGMADSYGVKWAGWTPYALGAGFMSLASLPLLIAPRFLLGIFVKTDLPANAQVVGIGTLLLACAALFQVVDGIQVISIGMLRGLHDTSVPMLLAAVGYWGMGLPLGAFLAFEAGFGGVGVWLGLSSGLAAVAILMTLRWMTLTRARSPGRPAKRDGAGAIQMRKRVTL